MGDRASVYVVENSDGDLLSGIYFYSHYRGAEWGTKVLANALAFGRSRWHDPAYLTRILASRMFADLIDSEAGGGISLGPTIGEHPITVVSMARGLVWQTREGWEKKSFTPEFEQISGSTFDEWVLLYADATA